MPPRRTAGGSQRSDYIDGEPLEGRDDSGSSTGSRAWSEEQVEASERNNHVPYEQNRRSRGVDSDEDGQDEEEGEEEEETINEGSQRRKRAKTVAGASKKDMKRWRHLAVEEKEALTNEGGMVWKSARPVLAALPANTRRECGVLLQEMLRNVEERFEKTIVPRTSSMPHASRNLGLATTGSMAGSIMSWQVERGERFVGDDEKAEANVDEEDAIAMLELGGFSCDIAVLERLLLPEATETVAMTRAIVEQEKELEKSRLLLDRLKADRESRKGVGTAVSSELYSWLDRGQKRLQTSGSHLLTSSQNFALREAAAE